MVVVVGGVQEGLGLGWRKWVRWFYLQSQFARSGQRSLRTSMLRRPWEVWRMTEGWFQHVSIQIMSLMKKAQKVHESTLRLESSGSGSELIYLSLPLTIAIHAYLPAGLLPVLDDRGSRVDDRAVHVEQQGREVDYFGRGGEVVFFVVRHLGKVASDFFLLFAFFLTVNGSCRLFWFSCVGG